MFPHSWPFLIHVDYDRFIDHKLGLETVDELPFEIFQFWPVGRVTVKNFAYLATLIDNNEAHSLFLTLIVIELEIDLFECF